MRSLNYICVITLALSATACMVDPVDTTYTSSVSGYQRGNTQLATSGLVPSDSSAATGVTNAASPSYASLSAADTPVIKQGVLLTGYVPAAGTPVAPSGPIIMPSAISTVSNGVPVIINNAASPYSSLSSSDARVIQPNVFGTPVVPQGYVVQPAYNTPR